MNWYILYMAICCGHSHIFLFKKKLTASGVYEHSGVHGYLLRGQSWCWHCFEKLKIWYRSLDIHAYIACLISWSSKSMKYEDFITSISKINRIQDLIYSLKCKIKKYHPKFFPICTWLYTQWFCAKLGMLEKNWNAHSTTIILTRWFSINKNSVQRIMCFLLLKFIKIFPRLSLIVSYRRRYCSFGPPCFIRSVFTFMSRASLWCF